MATARRTLWSWVRWTSTSVSVAVAVFGCVALMFSYTRRTDGGGNLRIQGGTLFWMSGRTVPLQVDPRIEKIQAYIRAKSPRTSFHWEKSLDDGLSKGRNWPSVRFGDFTVRMSVSFALPPTSPPPPTPPDMRLSVELPLWVPAAMIGAPALPPWVGVWRRRRAARAGLCPKCSYDRAGLAPSTVCPECGEPPRADRFTSSSPSTTPPCSPPDR